MISNNTQQADETTYERLRDASSLGTPAARKLRRRADPATAAQTWIDAYIAEHGSRVVQHPRSYHDARDIGERFRGGRPLLVDLNHLDEDGAKRLIDFMAGLTFALHGQIERIGNSGGDLSASIFLLTPYTGTSKDDQDPHASRDRARIGTRRGE